MTLTYMIRHAKPTSVWGLHTDPDPGLDASGQVQARTAADQLMALTDVGRLPCVVSSPLRRCRETAQPFADLIGVAVEVDARFGEIPTPAGLTHEDRGPWMRQAMQGRWSDIVGDLDYDQWRRSIAAALQERPGAVVFSHFVALNAAVSCATDEARAVSFRPDHASITIFDVAADAIALIERGPEAATTVL